MKNLLEHMIGTLDHGSGQVRHYTVKALLDLGENRREVILRLVKGLADPVLAVREEVKVALEKMAGMHNPFIFCCIPFKSSYFINLLYKGVYEYSFLQFTTLSQVLDVLIPCLQSYKSLVNTRISS